jgi:protein TonB
MFSWAHMSLVAQAGALFLLAVVFLAFFAIIGLRFVRRGTARFWTAPGAVALVLLPIALAAGITTLAFRQALDGMVLTGSGGVAALAAGSAEALVPLLVALTAAAPLAFVALLLTSFGSSRFAQADTGGGMVLPVAAFVAALMSAGLVALVVGMVAGVNGGVRPDGRALLLRINMTLAGAVLLALLLVVLAAATAMRAPRAASPLGIKLAAVSMLALCGILALVGAWLVNSRLQSYLATALTGLPEGSSPEPVGGAPGEAPAAPEAPPPPPPPARDRGARASTTAAPGDTGSDSVRVGGAIKQPKKIKNVPPTYPEIAKQARVQGVVILEATVGPDGRVSRVTVLRGVPLLDQAAIAAVEQWEYEPTLLNGVAVPVIMTVTVSFKLSSG